MENSEKRKLLQIARKSIESSFSGESVEIPASTIRRGAFVTLNKNGNLRGCIGYLTGLMPLYEEIFTLARSAAFEDYRFPPLREEELVNITIEISLLTEPEAIADIDGFNLEKDGIILSLHGRRAVFLPQVAKETGWSKEELMTALSEKAGFPGNAWKEEKAEFMTFQAEVFSEDQL